MADSLEARLRQIEAEIAKGAKIGRLPPLTKKAEALEATVRRVFATRPSAELAAALADLRSARALAKTTWERVQQGRLDWKGPRGGPREGPLAHYLRKGGWAATVPMEEPTGELQIVLATQRRMHHTGKTKDGKECDTDMWISDFFLVYRPALEPETKGSVDDPWLGIRGPKFRCYYPNSGAGDWESLNSTSSAGRWLNAWSQKSNYVRF